MTNRHPTPRSGHARLGRNRPIRDHHPTRLQTLIDRREALERQLFVVSMSDNFAETNGTLPAIRAEIAKVRREIEEITPLGV